MWLFYPSYQVKLELPHLDLSVLGTDNVVGILVEHEKKLKYAFFWKLSIFLSKEKSNLNHSSIEWSSVIALYEYVLWVCLFCVSTFTAIPLAKTKFPH